MDPEAWVGWVRPPRASAGEELSGRAVRVLGRELLLVAKEDAGPVATYRGAFLRADTCLQIVVGFPREAAKNAWEARHDPHILVRVHDIRHVPEPDLAHPVLHEHHIAARRCPPPPRPGRIPPGGDDSLSIGGSGSSS